MKFKKRVAAVLTMLMTISMSAFPVMSFADSLPQNTNANDPAKLTVIVNDNDIATMGTGDNEQSYEKLIKTAPTVKDVKKGDVYKIKYTVPDGDELSINVDKTDKNAAVTGDVKETSNTDANYSKVYSASKNTGIVNVEIAGNTKITLNASKLQVKNDNQTTQADNTAADQNKTDEKSDLGTSKTVIKVDTDDLESNQKEADKGTVTYDVTNLPAAATVDKVSESMTKRVLKMSTAKSPVVRRAAINVGKSWGHGIDDAALNAKNGTRGWPCTTYLQWALTNVYGIAGVPNGSTATQENWLKQNAQYVTTVRQGSNAGYNLVQPGDIAAFNGHVAIVGGDGKLTLHHGGIHSSQSVVWQYTLRESVQGGIMGSGHGSKEARIYRFNLKPPKGIGQVKKAAADNTVLTNACKNAYSLAGAEYTVYDGNKAVKVLKTDATGASQTEELDPKTYTIKETKAPQGYSLDKNTYNITIKENQTTTIKSNDSPLFNPVKVVLEKKSTGKSYLNENEDMSNAQFEVSYYDGLYDNVSGVKPTRTWVLKTVKDKNGKYVASMRDSSKVSGDDFFKTEKGEIVLPIGTVSIKEVKAPKGYKVDPKTYTFKVQKDEEAQEQATYNYGTEPEQPNTPLVPSIKTTAKDSKTQENIAEYGKKVTLVDTVSYKELSEGETYTLKGTLMDKSTGKALTVNGKTVTAEKTFTVTKNNSTIDGNGASGTVDLTYTVDSTLLSGKTTVVFENLYYNGKQIATHSDINDNGQTVHFPNVGTTASDSVTKDHVGTVSKTATVVDKVKYSNLIPGKSYTISGKLMNKDTNKPVVDASGKEITASKTFTAAKADGEEELTFTLDSTLLQGQSVVAFEDLKYKGITVGSHSVITDKTQTVNYPKIQTTAKDKKTGLNMTKAEKNATIVDSVKYTNLTVGKTYTMKGKLMDKSTGKALTVNGKTVTAEKTFTPSSANGTVDMEYKLDASKLGGETTVVFEDLYFGGHVVTTHSDINDNGQTVHIPKIGTTAQDKVTKGHEALASKETTLIDTVTYKNLVPGKEYNVTGTLMDKSTGKAILVNGKTVTAEKKFTPDKADGTVELSFNFDATSIAGKTVVAFESVKTEGKEVAVHADINDEGQTVHFPGLHTNADLANNGATENGNAYIIDKVSYSNLTVGKTYKISGKLMDKSTGKPFVVNGKEITSETEFTAKSANGTVNMTFTFPVKALAGKTTVVFEDLYQNDNKVGTHSNLQDKDQTVSIATLDLNHGGNGSGFPKTGDDARVMGYVIAALMAGVIVVTIVAKKKRGEEAANTENKEK